MFIYVNHLFIREDIKAHQDVDTVFLTLPSVAAKQNDGCTLYRHIST